MAPAAAATGIEAPATGAQRAVAVLAAAAVVVIALVSAMTTGAGEDGGSAPFSGVRSVGPTPADVDDLGDATLVIALTAEDEGDSTSRSTCIGSEVAAIASTATETEWNRDFFEGSAATPDLVAAIHGASSACS